MYILSSLSSSWPAYQIDLLQTWYGHNQHDVYSVQWPAPCRWLLGGWQWADSDQSAYCCSWISWCEGPVTSSLCMNVNRLVFSALTLTQTLTQALQGFLQNLSLVTIFTKTEKTRFKIQDLVYCHFLVYLHTQKNEMLLFPAHSSATGRNKG